MDSYPMVFNVDSGRRRLRRVPPAHERGPERSRGAGGDKAHRRGAMRGVATRTLCHCRSAICRTWAHTVRRHVFAMKTLTLRDAAALLHMNPEALRQKAKAGKVPGAKPGKCWVFVDDD